jgi:hypothetical protein
MAALADDPGLPDWAWQIRKIRNLAFDSLRCGSALAFGKDA